jgi:hypothetical protein
MQMLAHGWNQSTCGGPTPPVEGCSSHDSEALLWNWKFEFAVTAIEVCAVWSVAFTRFVHLEMLIGLVYNWTT